MAEETTNENLTIADLQTIVNIIDTATQRGAFRANELKVVGSVYEKTTAFLESVSEAEKEAAPEAESLEEEAEEEAARLLAKKKAEEEAVRLLAKKKAEEGGEE